MKLFAIAGTSGAGKSYLEQLLHNKYGFNLLPKYTTRDLRKSELGATHTQHIPIDQFLRYKNFIWTLHHHGNYYGWKQKDIPANLDANIVIAITLKSAMHMIEDNIDVQLILLHIELNNIALLRNRLIQREQLDKLTHLEQKHILEQIEIRIKKSKEEIKESQKYINAITNYGGQVFSIKDDNTIPQEIIPWILSTIQEPQPVHSNRVQILSHG